MDLRQKFQAVASGRIINIMDLEIAVKYPVVLGIHLITSVMFILNVRGDTNVKIFLPPRYAALCSHSYIFHNCGKEKWKLVNRGLCSTSNEIILALEN
jgi:hypothetical protein